MAGALGGAAATGDADTPPLKAFGELNFMVSGAYVAIAALAALAKVRKDGQGQRASLSARVHASPRARLHVLLVRRHPATTGGKVAAPRAYTGLTPMRLCLRKMAVLWSHPHLTLTPN